MKFAFWIIFTLIHYIKNQTTDANSLANMSCNLVLLNAFGLKGLSSPRTGSVVCGSVKNNCCQKVDELFIHKLYSTKQKLKFDKRYSSYMESMPAIPTILSTTYTGNVNGTIKFFNSTVLTKPLVSKLTSLWNLTANYNVTNALIMLQNATENLTKVGKRVGRIRSGFYCTLCDYSTNQAVDFNAKTITVSQSFCTSLVSEYLFPLYVKFNVIYPYLIFLNDFAFLATNQTLFGTNNDRNEIIRIQLILTACLGSKTATANCTAFCTEFKLDEASVLFDGDATIMATYVSNFNSNFPSLMSAEPSATIFQSVVTMLNITRGNFIVNCSVCLTKDANCTNCTSCQNCTKCSNGTNCTNCAPALVCPYVAPSVVPSSTVVSSTGVSNNGVSNNSSSSTGSSSNGVSSNGVSSTGSSSNGVSSNGVSSNGVSNNRSSSNGVSSNGVSSNSVSSNGSSSNGVSSTGVSNNSSSSNGSSSNGVSGTAGPRNLFTIFDSSPFVSSWSETNKNVKKSYPRILSEVESEISPNAHRKSKTDLGIKNLKGRLLAELVFQDRKGFRNLKLCKKQLYKYTEAVCQKDENGSKFMIKFKNANSKVLGREFINQSIMNAEMVESKREQRKMRMLRKTKSSKKYSPKIGQSRRNRKRNRKLELFDLIASFIKVPPQSVPVVSPEPTPPRVSQIPANVNVLTDPNQIYDYAGHSKLPVDPSSAPDTPVAAAKNKSLSLFGNIVDVRVNIPVTASSFITPVSAPIFTLFEVMPDPATIFNFTHLLAKDKEKGTNPILLGQGNFFDIEIDDLISQLFASDVVAFQEFLSIDADIQNQLLVNDKEEIRMFLNNWGAGFEVFIQTPVSITVPPSRRMKNEFRIGVGILGLITIASLWRN